MATYKRNEFTVGDRVIWLAPFSGRTPARITSIPNGEPYVFIEIDEPWCGSRDYIASRGALIPDTTTHPAPADEERE